MKLKQAELIEPAIPQTIELQSVWTHNSLSEPLEFKITFIDVDSVSVWKPGEEQFTSWPTAQFLETFTRIK